MSTSAPISVIQNGLVLCLDAANTKSYSRSGTTWTDLSRNSNNGTLTNGPTFSTTNQGNIVFDGINDYAEIVTKNTNLEFQPTQKYSAFCWVYNITNGTGAIFANMVGESPYQGWDLWRDGNNKIAAHLINTWSNNAIKIRLFFDFAANTNKWVNIGYTYNGSSPNNATDALNSINFYINGNLSNNGKENADAVGFTSTSETITYNSSQRFRIACRWSASGFVQGSPVTMGSMYVYNRVLTPSEILQNYNSTKSRFGL